MSALFRAEIDSLQRLVAQHAAHACLSANERERVRTDRSGEEAHALASVENLLRQHGRPLFAAEIANRLGINHQRINRLLRKMCATKTVTRRRAQAKRQDGQGHRHSFKYRIAP